MCVCVCEGGGEFLVLVLSPQHGVISLHTVAFAGKNSSTNTMTYLTLHLSQRAASVPCAGGDRLIGSHPNAVYHFKHSPPAHPTRPHAGGGGSVDFTVGVLSPFPPFLLPSRSVSLSSPYSLPLLFLRFSISRLLAVHSSVTP